MTITPTFNGNVAHYLAAMLAVGRNLREIQDFGRVLTDGERKEVARIEAAYDAAYSVGMDAASNGAKLKTNPHDGGSAEWWGWNEGYKASKKIAADAERQRQREARGR